MEEILDGGSAAPPTADVPTFDRIISVRLTSRLGERVEQAARARGWDMSTFIRDLLARATSTLGSDEPITTTAGPFSELEFRWVTDHSGAAGEATPLKGTESDPADRDVASPSGTPDQGSAANVAGGVAVSDDAVRAFNVAWWNAGDDVDPVQVGLAAAAPLIAAQALRAAAAELIGPDSAPGRLAPTGHDDLCDYGPSGECSCCQGEHYRWLMARADELERGGDHG